MSHLTKNTLRMNASWIIHLPSLKSSKMVKSDYFADGPSVFDGNFLTFWPCSNKHSVEDLHAYVPCPSTPRTARSLKLLFVGSYTESRPKTSSDFYIMTTLLCQRSEINGNLAHTRVDCYPIDRRLTEPNYSRCMNYHFRYCGCCQEWTAVSFLAWER